MDRQGLYVSIPNSGVRWLLKRAALDYQCTVRALVLGILNGWLAEHGYRERVSDGVPAVDP
jgi:hypothetical protein